MADVLDAKCVGCHGAALAENKLNMETVAGMLKGGKRGPAIVPGKADESLLFKMAAPPGRAGDAARRTRRTSRPSRPRNSACSSSGSTPARRTTPTPRPRPAKPVELGTLPPGVQPINAVDLTADGRRVASGRANVVEVFDVDSGLPIITLGGHRDLIQSVRFSPDARRLAAGQLPGRDPLGLSRPPRLERTFAGSPEPIKAMVATRDGKTLITGGPEKALRFWNTADGKILQDRERPGRHRRPSPSPPTSRSWPRPGRTASSAS